MCPSQPSPPSCPTLPSLSQPTHHSSPSSCPSSCWSCHRHDPASSRRLQPPPAPPPPSQGHLTKTRFYPSVFRVRSEQARKRPGRKATSYSTMSVERSAKRAKSGVCVILLLFDTCLIPRGAPASPAASWRVSWLVAPSQPDDVSAKQVRLQFFHEPGGHATPLSPYSRAATAAAPSRARARRAFAR